MKRLVDLPDVEEQAPAASLRAIDLTLVARRRFRRRSAQRAWRHLSWFMTLLIAGAGYGVLRDPDGSLQPSRLWLPGLFTLGVLVLAVSLWACVSLGRPEDRSAWVAVGLAPLVSIAGVIGVIAAVTQGRVMAADAQSRADTLWVLVITYGVLSLALLPASLSVLRTIRMRNRAGAEEAVLLSLVFPWTRLKDYFLPEGAGTPTLALVLLAVGTGAFVVLQFVARSSVAALAVATVFAVGSGAAGRHFLRGRIRDFRTALESDGRAPVLFLRPFADDHRAVWRLSPPSVVEAGSVRRTFAEFVCRALGTVGPVIAIAEPGCTRKTIGVAQQSLSDAEWQEKALELMRRAGVIVLLAGQTSGIKWEWDQLVQNGYLEKTIVLMPRGGGPAARAAWAVLSDTFEAATSVPLPEAPHLARAVAFLPSLNGDRVVLSVKRANRPRHYELGLRAAIALIRHERQNARSLARTPRQRRSARRRFALAAGLLLMGVVAPVVMVTAAPSFQHSTQSELRLEMQVLGPPSAVANFAMTQLFHGARRLIPFVSHGAHRDRLVQCSPTVATCRTTGPRRSRGLPQVRKVTTRPAGVPARSGLQRAVGR